MSKVSDRVIEAKDLSPILNLNDEDDAWLRQLARVADSNVLTLQMSQRDREDAEPVVSFDERSGHWRSGRYIGELRYQGVTLRILPRFGMPQLHRWLSRIWGVRLISSKGRYENSRIWLWELLAKLWETRLLAAAKHGPPATRTAEIHEGPTIRGRLEVRSTAKAFAMGRHVVVSTTRNRKIDQQIADLIVGAFGRLRRELRQLGDERSWLTDRGAGLLGQLRSQAPLGVNSTMAESQQPIRYTPIIEGYRGVVDLSRAIIRQRPFSSTGEGTNEVLGALIDMAEVWELYVFNLLRNRLRAVEVVHTGRGSGQTNYLLRSRQTGARLGRLKPDVLLFGIRTGRLLAIIDAKYKTTEPSLERPDGIYREDLYQLAAYLSAHGDAKEALSGGLVYPATMTTSNIQVLQRNSPWILTATERALWFFGLVSEETGANEECYQGEATFLEAIENMLAL